ncbi:glycoside hydrolase family 5 protein [Treponema sp.]|uniref:glycoside hydrolase family 5 protein n=1 Tax=Treponema sp. TaxID=166 RepID=UPI00298DAD0E|nr:glycoside hydrolase family 5 protein [Treponema sp.]MCR5612393.1 glycoside hydrolase family 5 protein [Treponema sp.]
MAKKNFFIVLCFVFCAGLFVSCGNPASSNGGTTVISVPSLPEGQTINLADSSITAANIVTSMKFGWNLGNTLDANYKGDNWNIQAGSAEIDWGHVNTASVALFQKLYDDGIRSVRIPISWHNHVTKVNGNWIINAGWLDHVQNVVNMAYERGLYVIINIHHDNFAGSSLGNNPGFTLNNSDLENSRKYVKEIWEQVANRFKNYDGHLVFETLNEPRVIGGEHEWNCSNNWTCSDCQNYFNIINTLNQDAVNTIRASGSNNASRVIMFPAYVAAPYAAINGKNANLFRIPTDSATNKLALSVHMYTPYNFAMEDPGSSTLTQSHKNDLSSHFTALNTTFISQGIPVVIGEMGATNKNNDSARTEWFTYYLGLCKQYGVAAILWDNGNWQVPTTGANAGSYNELFGFYDRTAQTWYFPDMITAAINERN